MNFKTKRPAFLWALTLSFFLNACWGKGNGTKNGDDFGFFKTPGAAEACVATNLSQWELTGKFLHDFLSCASNKSADGTESLNGLQNLLVKLDETKLQKVLDFILTVDPKGTTHEEQYPYLLAASTLLDRGLVEGRATGLNLTSERLDTLQDFLQSLDMTRGKEILSAWSRSGRLAEVLNELGAYVDLLAADSLESATHELLAGNTVKPEFLAMSRRFLKEDLLFTNISVILGKRQARALSPDQQQKLLLPFRESLTASDSQALAINAVENAPATTPLAAFDDSHSQYSPDELKGLTAIILDYWRSYQKLSETERHSLDTRLAGAMNSILGQQAHSVKWLLAFLGDGNSLRAKDFDRITYAVDQLLLEGNNLSLEAIRAKAGASKLTYRLQLLLTQGGKVADCSFFDQPVLGHADDYAAFAAALNSMSVPQTNCRGRIPLIAAIENITGTTIGEDCGNQGTCLAETIPLTASQDLWATDGPSPDITKKLVLDSIKRLQDLTADDPYALYNLQLANDSLEPALLGKIQRRVNENSDWTMNGLARLDEVLDQEFVGSLQKDFLEKLLTYRIETLASQSHQFADLAPEQAAEIDGDLERRTSRIFAGLYSEGPIEGLFRKKLSLAQFSGTFSADQQDLKRYLENHPSIWSRIVFKAKQADGIFRSPTTGALSGENLVAFSGAGSSLRNYLSYSTEPGAHAGLVPVINEENQHRILQPLQATRSFADDEQGRSAWALWMQHYASGPLGDKDVPVDLAGKLDEWYRLSFIPTVSADDFWPELKAGSAADYSSGLSDAFYDVEPYSADEARLLTTYYLKQYQKLSPALPAEPDVAFGNSSAPKSDLTAFDSPIRGFLNISYLVKDDYEAQYSAYAKYFPKYLLGGSQLSLLKKNVLPDYATFQSQIATWNFAEQAQVNDVLRLPGDTESPLALLSNLDLLTFSKQNKFLPQSLVGFNGKLCQWLFKDPLAPTKWKSKPVPCPLDFQGATEEAAYEKFREYVSTRAIQAFCPLLATDTFGPRMVWSQRLGLSLESRSLCGSQSDTNALESYRFPTWHSSKVLNDIFTMGRKAKLKAGLVQIPSALRFYKLKQQKLADEQVSTAWLEKGKGVWSERNASSQRRRAFFAGGFWVGSPNLLNSYLNLISNHVDSYTWRTTLIAFAEKDDQGQSTDTLRDLLRTWSTQQKASAAADESAFTFAFKLIEAIGENPQFRSFIANFVTNLNSSEAYDFYSNELPLATIQLFPADINPFDWQDKGLSFAKYFGQHSTLRSWQIIGESFSPAEIDRFIDQTHFSFRLIPEIADRSKILGKLSSEVTTIATLFVPEDGTHLTESFEALALTWSRVSLGQTFQNQWATFVSNLAHPLQGLNGVDTMSGESALESLLSALILRGPSLLHEVWEAGSFRDPLFWRNTADSLLASIETHGDGATAFANFLAQRRFDLGNGGLWLDLLHPSDLQDKGVLAVAAIDSVPETLWRAAMEEEAQVSSRLGKALGFLRSHIVWKIDPGHNAFSIALDQLYELSQDEKLRTKQLELVTLWLKGESPDLSQSPDKR